MKEIVLFFLLIYNFSFSQKITVNEVDEFTGERKIYCAAFKGNRFKNSDDIAKGVFWASFLTSQFTRNKEKNSLILTINFQSPSIKCLNDNSFVIFKLSDNSTIKLNHIGRINCHESTMIGFYEIPGDLTEIKNFLSKVSTNKISKMRLSYADEFYDIEIIEEKKQIIKDHFKLLLEEIEKI